MGELYVNAATGVDASGGGAPAAPLRTITFAVSEAVTRFGAEFSILHVAEGRHNQALGEILPILLPQNISLIGAGIGRTIIEAGGDLLFPAVELAIQSGREITGITLVAVPIRTCVGRGIRVVHEGTSIHDIAISGDLGARWGTWHGIYIDRVAARIENVEITGPLVGMYASSEDGARSTIRGSTFTAAPVGVDDFSGEISNNYFEPNDSQVGVGVYGASDVTISGNGFRGWKGISLKSSDSSRPAVRSTISDNDFDCRFGIDFDHQGPYTSWRPRAGDAEVRHNNFRCSGRSAIAIRFYGGGDIDTAASPLIVDNTIVKAFDDSTHSLVQPLIEIDGHYSPVLELNSLEIRSAGSQNNPAVLIKSAARPDLGGGLGGSGGQNRFITSGLQIWSYETSVRRDIFAMNNFWRQVPARVFRGGSDYDTRGAEVSIVPADAAVTVHVEGAMSL